MGGGTGDEIDVISLALDDDEVVEPHASPAHRRSAVTERRLRAAELALRCMAFGLALFAAVLLVVDKETHEFLGLFVKVARYTDMPVLVLLVITHGMAASYNLLQGVRCLVSTVRGSALVSRPVASAIFICDQVMTYVVISAVAAALVSAMISKHGQPEFGWMKTADLYTRFSMQAAGAIVCAFVAGVIMVTVTAMSAFNLFRLYGSGKGRKM